MICDACKDAGYYNSVGSPVALDLAEKGHKECEDPSTCPCQHKVGDGHINKEFR